MLKTLLDRASNVFSNTLMTETMRIVVPGEMPKTGVGQVSSGKGSGVRFLLRSVLLCLLRCAGSPPPIIMPPQGPAAVPARGSFLDVTAQRAQRLYLLYLHLLLPVGTFPRHKFISLSLCFLLESDISPHSAEPSLCMNEWCLEGGRGQAQKPMRPASCCPPPSDLYCEIMTGRPAYLVRDPLLYRFS